MRHNIIRKAVFPVAGLGTRFLQIIEDPFVTTRSLEAACKAELQALQAPYK